jgi:TolB-like protein
MSACSYKEREVLGSVPTLENVSCVRSMGYEVTNIATVRNIGQAALLTSSELSKHAKALSQNIIVTSMVNIDNLQETSHFGRLYSEAMMTNFKRLGWNVTDFRGKEIVVRAKSGEFYLDRTQIKEIPANSVVYVGTYGKYGNGLLLNMRILDAKMNEVITASNVQLNDEHDENKSNFTIRVEQDNCCLTKFCKPNNQNACAAKTK